MPNKTTLSEDHQAAVKRMLATGKDPLSIRAIFRAVPERASQAREAFEYANSFSEIEVNVLSDLVMDELLEAAERRAIMERDKAAKAREAARASNAASEPAEAVEGPSEATEDKEKKKVMGHSVTGVIRWAASVGMDEDEIAAAIKEVSGIEVNPSTLKIQVKRFEKGEPVPAISQQLKAALMAAIK